MSLHFAMSNLRVCVLKELPPHLLEYSAARKVEEEKKKTRKKKRSYPRYANVKVARWTNEPPAAPAVSTDPEASFEAGFLEETAMPELLTAGDGGFPADFQDFIWEDEFLPCI